MDYLKIVFVAVIVLLISKFLIKITSKELIGMIVNIVVAIAVLFLVNLSGFVHIDINLITVLVTAILGVPGVVILIILAICGVI